MTRESLVESIRQLAEDGAGLFRIHRNRPELYARARRMFGSWSAAVKAAGLDYESAIRTARARSRDAIRKNVQAAVSSAS
jgi:hypothetical protein